MMSLKPNSSNHSIEYGIWETMAAGIQTDTDLEAK
jgi:hypothetical protein